MTAENFWIASLVLADLISIIGVVGIVIYIRQRSWWILERKYWDRADVDDDHFMRDYYLTVIEYDKDHPVNLWGRLKRWKSPGLRWAEGTGRLSTTGRRCAS